MVTTYRHPGTYNLDTLCSGCADDQGLGESHRYVVLQDGDAQCSCCGKTNPPAISAETAAVLATIQAVVRARVQRAAHARLN